ncbi:leucine-rich repeat receptor-like tyrosine-protein kinase PXC3 isoform X2 [Rhododendron vialii]|uniref:leucine-rich repeat receptor-like tyrosine-protein kinase PXC3 isoform X2 n=1 Tax=Rhododendron vialii TaxID=182163 RepID=UPI00265FD78B|nr:leucine-rich repeat receptor-like tyrosine-protein kinase PXC3 isoform X2 [Rhododendron vialii]
MRRYVPITSLLLPLFFLFHFVLSEIPLNQRNTMIKLCSLLQNNTAQPPLPWNISRDPCSWKGVTCNSDNSFITRFSIQFFSLSNPDFLPLLCQINSLESIDLSDNHLSSIPSGFMTACGNLSGLRELNFSRNRLSGSLPNFDGFLKLESLDLSHNSLNETIRLQLDGLVSLKILSLGYNQFIGKIPEEIANYSNLTFIDLSVNNLSGSIPDRFGELQNLQVLILSSNNLSGGIPQFLSSVETLQRFAANQNSFSGDIPPGITKFLRNLDLSYNQLNGPLQNDLLSQPNLETVDLSYNSLGGWVPINMSSSLVRLRLGNNRLNGAIPSSAFGSLKKLTYLELDNNSLGGSIPSQLGLCENLALLNLAKNQLTGVLPVELGNLTNLQELKLQANKLVGEIPIEITQLQWLRKLNISWNALNGSIPPSVSRLQNLNNLDLRGNNLSGSIPASIGNLTSLIELQLGSNKLGGKIPLMPQSLQIALNLSSNQFEGLIPETLSRLNGLEVLDLSNNRFTGQIPDSFVTMESLTQLVLSNNRLFGLIPKFRPYVSVNTTGNTGLIEPTNPSPTQTKKRVTVGLVAVTIAVSAFAIFIGTIVVLLISRRFYKTKDERIQSEEHFSQPQVIRGNLLTPNAVHRSNIDFNKAMEAVTNPSNIILKTRFSTYYKSIMPSGISYFVKKLNWSDKIFQLGTHEKFSEELESLGKLNNSNVMTPLAYVVTLDSAYLFYEFAQKGTLFDVLHGSLGEALDWGSRYSIAIGVAQGLAFLHGGASGPVLLLDLSSKSILLKSLKEPQVGDIELCKVIDPTKSSGSLSAVAGSVGYIPPEYAYTMRVTMAGNVYSFGVILLELVTGKSAVSQGTELAKLVLSNSVKQDKMDHILDFSISRTSLAVRSQMLAVLRVALACVSISPEARPKTKSILRMLLNAR